VAIDAEQTYLQGAIRSACEQYQRLHNSADHHILQTYQAYLKATSWHIDVEVLKKELLGTPMCVK